MGWGRGEGESGLRSPAAGTLGTKHTRADRLGRRLTDWALKLTGPLGGGRVLELDGLARQEAMCRHALPLRLPVLLRSPL